MNAVKIFENEEFGRIRAIEINGEPYFVGKDVAETLGYAKPLNALATHIDEDDSLKQGLIDSMGRTQEAIFINESGLYSLILSSKLPNAKKFKKWVTSDVLPTIRKKGSYSIAQKPDSYMIDDPVERAKRWIEEYEERKALENTIEEQKPLVEYAEQIQASDDTIDMKEMADVASKRGIKIGRNTLFAFLRDRKILTQRNVPYATFIAQDWFEVKEDTYRTYSGRTGISLTTRITPKGQMAIINQLKKYYIA